MNSDVVLIAAGLLAGAMNALAGGGSFVSLPALIAAGVHPVVANASSSLALYPGGLASAWVYRRDLAPVAEVPLSWLAAVSLLGGLIGSVLLLATPEVLFLKTLPWLLLAATCALAFGRRLARRWRGEAEVGRGTMLGAQFVLGIYGGYFGGAVGIMMMAFWAIATTTDLKRQQGPRTLLVTAANTAAIVFFVVMGAVNWRAVLLLAPAAAVGGWLGALLGTRLSPRMVQAATVTLAAIVTVAFFLKGYA